MPQNDQIAIATWIRDNPDQKDTEAYSRAVQALQILTTQQPEPTGGDTTFLSEWMESNPDQQGTPRWNNAEQLLAGNRPEAPAIEEYAPTGMDKAVDRVYGSSPMRFMQGTAQLPLGAAQLVGRGVGGALEGAGYEDNVFSAGADAITESMRVAEAMKRRGMDQQGKNWDVAGFMGQMATPAMALKGIPAAAGLGGRMAQGLGLGAATGAASPVTGDNYWETKGVQTGLGGALGAVIPGVAQVTRNIVDPFLPAIRGGLSGVQRSAARMANSAAGDRFRGVVDALKNTFSYSDDAMVRATPGRSPEFNALMKQAGNRQGQVGPIGDMTRQAAARRNAEITSLGGSPTRRALLEAGREEAATPLYNAARRSQTPVDVSRTVGLIDEATANNPAWDNITGPLKIIRNKLVQRPQARPQGRVSISRSSREQTPETLQESSNHIISVINKVKSMMDSMVDGKPEYGAAMRYLRDIKASLDDEVASVIPQHGQANAVYSRMSTPINRMDIGNELGTTFIPAMAEHGGAQASRGSMLATAMKKAPNLIQKATNYKHGGTLDDAMGAQMNIINQVADDFGLEQMANKLATEGSPAVRRMVAEQTAGGQFPGILERTIVIINSILKRAGGLRTEKTMQELARLRQNPQELARVMSMVDPLDKPMVAEMLSVLPAAAAAEGIDQGSSALQ